MHSEVIELFFAFIFGLAVGSFLNVCICRIPKGESIVYPPSRCPKCKEPIKWYDNIPVISYLLLRGKCRNCGSPISIQYPLVELLTGVLTVVVVYALGFSLSTFGVLFISYGLICFWGIKIRKKRS
jgi:leader peptidase (prepilin peptidase)/N-methyltransferase